jgi:hypothetical protein
MQKDFIFSRLAAFVLLIAFASPCLAGSGGPDNYGYTWKDSNEPEVTYNWIDITNRTDAVQVTNLGDDDTTPSIFLGFSFRYYWIDFNAIRIGSNGWLSFDTGFSNNSWCFQNMPSTKPATTNNTLAPLLSDMTFLSSYAAFPNPGELYYWTNFQDSFVVTFVDLPWWKDDTSMTVPPDWIGQNTFQVILNSSDTTITFQYEDLTQSAFVNRPECPSEIVVGIENSTGLIGLQASVEVVPPDSYAIRFYYPGEDTFEVRDAAAIWSMNEQGKGTFFLVGDSLEINGLINNAGNVQIDTPVVVEARMRTESQVTLWLESDTLDSMPVATPLQVQYAQGPLLGQSGQFFVNIEVMQAGDVNQYNNRAQCEIDVVSQTDSAIVLQYAYNNFSGTSISWPSGNNGVGMYIDFPYYPYRITGIEAFIVGNDADTLTPLPSGFLLEVLEEDSMGGPGMVLENIPISSFDARDGWNYRDLSAKPVINQGGFYVSWVQGGTGIGLGTQRTGPKSRRTFEIFANAWAPYRFADTEDLMIRVYIDRFWVANEPEEPQPFAEVKVVPNPGNGQFSLLLRQEKPGPMEIEVFDLNGRTLHSRDFAGITGMRNFAFDLTGTPAGIYWLELRQDNRRHVEKLVIRP